MRDHEGNKSWVRRAKSEHHNPSSSVHSGLLFQGCRSTVSSVCAPSFCRTSYNRQAVVRTRQDSLPPERGFQANSSTAADATADLFDDIAGRPHCARLLAMVCQKSASASTAATAASAASAKVCAAGASSVAGGCGSGGCASPDAACRGALAGRSAGHKAGPTTARLSGEGLDLPEPSATTCMTT